jgi:hypothetical protein
MCGILLRISLTAVVADSRGNPFEHECGAAALKRYLVFLG